MTTPSTNWDYAPAPESTKVEMKPQYGLFIDGAFREPRSGRSIETINPATESSLSRISEADAADVNLAVVAARKALKNWRRVPALERAKYLYRIARRIQERARELAVLETMDNGKPIRESRDEDVPQAAASRRAPGDLGSRKRKISKRFPMPESRWKYSFLLY